MPHSAAAMSRALRPVTNAHTSFTCARARGACFRGGERAMCSGAQGRERASCLVRPSPPTCMHAGSRSRGYMHMQTRRRLVHQLPQNIVQIMEVEHADEQCTLFCVEIFHSWYVPQMLAMTHALCSCCI